MLLEKLPPQNLDAEHSALGSCLIDNEAGLKAAEVLPNPEDFYREAHKSIYSVILYLLDKNEPTDLITVSNELKRRGQLEEIGGISYLTTLIEAVPTSANVVHYATIIREKAILRNLIYAGNAITSLGFQEEEEAIHQMDKAEQLIFAISQQRSRGDFIHIQPILSKTFDIIQELFSRKARVTGIPTGFSDLDHYTAGFQKSDLIILAARPGMGKTALALNIAAHAASREKLPVAIFSLEMSKEQLAQRFLCAEARINGTKLRTGYLEEADWRPLTNAINLLSEAPIYIDDSPSPSVLEMRSKVRKLKKKAGVEMVIIDYLQLMRSSGRADNRNLELSEISRSLKALAKELNIPVIALSQLSRKVEERQDKRPQLSDLRESGAIEQDADLVMFVFRDDYYNKESEENTAELIIAKQRNGPLGTVEMVFLKHYAKFESMAKHDFSGSIAE